MTIIIIPNVYIDAFFNRRPEESIYDLYIIIYICAHNDNITSWRSSRRVMRNVINASASVGVR